MQKMWFVSTCLVVVVAAVGAMIIEPPVITPEPPSDAAVKPKIYFLHIKSDVRFRFATTLVTSKIANADTQAHQTTFKVTLPNEAFITNFTLTVGNNTYIGDVKRKEEARQEYEEAVSQGRSAAHITVRPRETNMFNIDVNIAAEQKLTFELRYQELLQRKLGSYNHVIYVQPGEPVQDLRIDVDIYESRMITNLEVPPIRNDILTDIDITERNEVAIINRISDRRVHIRYQPSVEQQISEGDSDGLNGQFTVTYDVDRQNDGGDILLVNGYFVHFFAPTGLRPRPKNAVFILDKSGSMSGTKIRQLREAMLTILSQLDPVDKFNILAFDSGVTFWRNEQQLVAASEANIEAAKNYISELHAGGGTNIQEAMLSGISMLERQDDFERSSVIFFLTDGEPTSGETSPSRILQRVFQRNEDSVPVFSLAFGRNADYSLVRRLAAQNNGFGRKIYEDSDADLQISKFYAEVSTVILKDVTFTYLNVDDSDEPIPIPIICDLTPTLLRGSELVVTGRITEEETNELRPQIRGIGADGLVTLLVPESSITTELNITQDSDAFSITEKLWAYLTIKQWIKQMEASTDEHKQESWKENITAMALKYNFVTPLTSMVVTLPDELQAAPVHVEEDEEDEIGFVDPSFDMSHFMGGSQIASLPVATSQRRFYTSSHVRNSPPLYDPFANIGRSGPISPPVYNLRPHSIPKRPLGRRRNSSRKTKNRQRIPMPTHTSAPLQTSTFMPSQPTSMGTTQPTSMGTTQPTSMGTTQPTSIGTTQPTSMRTTQPTSMSNILGSSTLGMTSTPTIELTTRMPNNRQFKRMIRTRFKASDYTLLTVKGVNLPLCFRNPGSDSVDDATMYNLTRDTVTDMSVSVGYTFYGLGRRRRTKIARIRISTSNTTTEMIPGFRTDDGVRQRSGVYSVFGQGPNLKWEVVNTNNRLSILADFSRNTNRNIQGSLVVPILGQVREKRHTRKSRKGKLTLKAMRRGVKETIKTRVKFSKPMQCWIVKTQQMLDI